MKSLNRLVRLQQKKIDEQRLFVGQISDRINRIEAELNQLNQTLAQEQEMAAENLDAAMMFPAYAAGVKQRKKRLSHYLQEVRQQLATEQEKLQNQFMELKRVEILEEARLTREKQAQDLKIQNEQEDLVIVRYKRS